MSHAQAVRRSADWSKGQDSRTADAYLRLVAESLQEAERASAALGGKVRWEWNSLHRSFQRLSAEEQATLLAENRARGDADIFSEAPRGSSAGQSNPPWTDMFRGDYSSRPQVSSGSHRRDHLGCRLATTIGSASQQLCKAWNSAPLPRLHQVSFSAFDYREARDTDMVRVGLRFSFNALIVELPISFFFRLREHFNWSATQPFTQPHIAKSECIALLIRVLVALAQCGLTLRWEGVFELCQPADSQDATTHAQTMADWSSLRCKASLHGYSVDSTIFVKSTVLTFLKRQVPHSISRYNAIMEILHDHTILR